MKIILNGSQGETIKLVFPQAAPPPPPTPPPAVYRRKDIGLRVDFSQGEFWRARHDFELAINGYAPPKKYGVPRQRVPGYPQLKPVPETVMQFGRHPVTDRVYDFVPFTPEWQQRSYELLEWVIDGKLPKGEKTGRYWQKINGKKVFVDDNPLARVEYTPFSMMEIWEDTYSDSVALTDGHAFDNGRADYIQGRNLSAAPMDRKCLLMGGLPVRKLGTRDKMTIIETLDPTLPPPSLDWILQNKPYLIGWGTEIGCLENQHLPDGRWTVAMWGKFKPACAHYGLEAVGTPYFIFGIGGTSLVPTSSLMPMTQESYSMYVPEKY